MNRGSEFFSDGLEDMKSPLLSSVTYLSVDHCLKYSVIGKKIINQSSTVAWLLPAYAVLLDSHLPPER